MGDKKYVKLENDRLTDAFGRLAPEEYRGIMIVKGGGNE